MRIAIVTSLYPYKGINDFVFVENFVKSLVDLGESLTVVSPFSVTKSLMRHRPFLPSHEVRNTDKGNTYDIYWPKCVSFGNTGFRRLAATSEKRAIERTLNKIDKPDVIIAKFYSEGSLVYEYARRNNIPLVIDNGESSISKLSLLSDQQRKDYVSTITAVISNSSKCKEEGVALRLTTPDKNVILPNGIDPMRFHREERAEMRRRLGFPQDDFIVAFTGWFTNRKGSKRVSDAITRLNNPNIKSIFIGKETVPSMTPDCEGILYRGTVLNKQMYQYLSAADVFVLPTLAEGCCNAIIEAMACGLPVISSDRNFNNEILGDEYSFRIDPENILAIAEKIDWMFHHREERTAMGQKAWEAAQNMTLENRGRKIIEYLKTIVK